MTTDDKGSRGITLFDPPAGAPDLMDTGVMSMPVADPPADEQFTGWALSGGHMTKVLFRQGGDDGMSLVWSWFAVGAGGGFFVPADAPYAYTAGPEGIQILEFRGVSSFDMQITERLPRWDKILETVHDKQESWQEAAAGVL